MFKVILRTDINKAIVKVKPNQRSAHSHFSLEGILNPPSHNSGQTRTCFCIEIWCQLGSRHKTQLKQGHRHDDHDHQRIISIIV